jgi:bacteriorhodopsin
MNSVKIVNWIIFIFIVVAIAGNIKALMVFNKDENSEMKKKEKNTYNLLIASTVFLFLFFILWVLSYKLLVKQLIKEIKSSFELLIYWLKN